MDTNTPNVDASGENSFSFIKDVISNPLNLVLCGVCIFLVYRLIRTKNQENNDHKNENVCVNHTPLKKQDFTLEQLKKYDGIAGDKRILLAVNGKVFDVTKGSKFYGPDGPYGVFAGHDASRGLGTFNLGPDAIKDEYDDLCDLTTGQMDSIKEWEMQFTERYELVGNLLKPGDEPNDYSLENNESN